MVSQKKSITFSAATQSRIRDRIRELDSADPQAHKRYKAAAQKWEKVIRPLEDAVAASEQLTQKDLAIRINARD